MSGLSYFMKQSSDLALQCLAESVISVVVWTRKPDEVMMVSGEWYILRMFRVEHSGVVVHDLNDISIGLHLCSVGLTSSDIRVGTCS